MILDLVGIPTRQLCNEGRAERFPMSVWNIGPDRARLIRHHYRLMRSAGISRWVSRQILVAAISAGVSHTLSLPAPTPQLLVLHVKDLADLMGVDL